MQTALFPLQHSVIDQKGLLHLPQAVESFPLMMILTGTENIREVVAFPKNQKAMDLMTEAPSEVLLGQLKELGLCLNQA